MRPTSLAAALLLFTTLLLGQAAESPLDFARGPARWLMTAEEQRAWRSVKTEPEAQELVDLFWARRDPTPGTFANEFRDEFKTRVEFADQRFKEGNRRGALSERGRVLIVLGFPHELGEEAQKRTGQFTGAPAGVPSNDPTGGRAIAARDTWTYTYDQSIKFGMPKIEVVFIHDGAAGRVRRDTHRNDFISALPAAIKSYIKSPNLTSVPEWARNAEIARVPATAVADLDPESDQPAAETSSDAAVRAAQTAAPRPAAATQKPAVRPAGVGKLTLVADAFAIEPQSGKDPFATITSKSEFRRDGELGWVVEYCTGDDTLALPVVEVKMKISAFIRGERVNFNAPPEELAPDSIKASPGCYLVRGGVPLMDMDPADYTLILTVGRYNLAKEFRVIE